MGISMYHEDIKDIEKYLGKLSKSMEETNFKLKLDQMAKSLDSMAKSMKAISDFLISPAKQEKSSNDVEEYGDMPDCFVDSTILAVKKPDCYGQYNDKGCLNPYCKDCARKV